jgi:hypothetical protein
MATVFNRGAMRRTADRSPASDAKFSGAKRIAIIFGSSIVFWTIILSMIVHYS